MCHKKLEWMRDSLICVVENQLCNLEEVDAKELGEAVDMIKDLEEAIYYCTVTEAMKDNAEMDWELKEDNHLQEPNSNSRMYYSGKRYPMMHSDKDYYHRDDGTVTIDSNGHGSDDHMQRDDREGRSYNSRRMYMEAKDMKRDKAIQLRELERYMQELSQDITEMIADASPEEKQYLEKKITALASKIGQMK